MHEDRDRSRCKWRLGKDRIVSLFFVKFEVFLGVDYSLIPIQAKKPPTVDKLTNQLKTVAAPFETFMNDKNAKQLVNKTAASGKPLFVHHSKMRGA